MSSFEDQKYLYKSFSLEATQEKELILNFFVCKKKVFDTQEMALVINSLSLSFLYVFNLRHSEDGADFIIFILYLSFF